MLRKKESRRAVRETAGAVIEKLIPSLAPTVRYPSWIESEQMQDHHSNGEIGKVDKDRQTEVERHHGGPDPTPRSPEQSQRGAPKFQHKRRPSPELKYKARPTA